MPAFERARYLSARGLRDHRPNFEKARWAKFVITLELYYTFGLCEIHKKFWKIEIFLGMQD
jgi:hypothetical protein